jgi:hypothetical protein
MYRLLSLIVLAASLTACSQPPPAAAPTPVASDTAVSEPEPTVTAAPELEPTPSAEIAPTTQPAPTLPAYQAVGTVLEAGPAGSWDAGGVREGFVLVHQGQYYLFYTGFATSANLVSAIGFATSADGLSWEKYVANPILQADGQGFDAYRVYWPIVMVSAEGWTLYYGATPDGETRNARAIGLARADSPEGEWQRQDDPILTAGSTDRWDSLGMAPGPVVLVQDAHWMYFSAFGSGGAYIGLATSPDGQRWTKWDDPDTTTIAFSESDPIFSGQSGSWDRIVWGASVLSGETGWLLFYHGDALNSQDPGLGLASSSDGLTWQRPYTEPILLHAGDRFPQAPSAVWLDGALYLYYTPISRAPGQTQIELAIYPSLDLPVP